MQESSKKRARHEEAKEAIQRCKKEQERILAEAEDELAAIDAWETDPEEVAAIMQA